MCSTSPEKEVGERNFTTIKGEGGSSLHKCSSLTTTASTFPELVPEDFSDIDSWYDFYHEWWRRKKHVREKDSYCSTIMIEKVARSVSPPLFSMVVKQGSLPLVSWPLSFGGGSGGHALYPPSLSISLCPLILHSANFECGKSGSGIARVNCTRFFRLF